MEIVIRAAAVGITGSVLALLLKKHAPEMSMFTGMAVGLLVMGLVLTMAGEILEVARLAMQLGSVSSATLMPVLKCVGIGLVTHLAAQICRDAGQASIAATVEICGAFSAVYISLPLMRTLLETIGGLV